MYRYREIHLMLMCTVVVIYEEFMVRLAKFLIKSYKIWLGPPPPNPWLKIMKAAQLFH